MRWMHQEKFHLGRKYQINLKRVMNYIQKNILELILIEECLKSYSLKTMKIIMVLKFQKTSWLRCSVNSIKNLNNNKIITKIWLKTEKIN